jgi:hypothetical protein
MSNGKSARLKNILNLMGALLLVALVGCGGGGGSAGTPAGATSAGAGTTSTSGTATSSVTGFSIFLEKQSILNDGVDKSNVTVVVVNGSNNVVAGATVKVDSNNNSVFTPPATSLSDAGGSYIGSIRSGQDKTDRIVQLTVTVNNIVKTASLAITSGNVTVGGIPTVVVEIRDANNVVTSSVGGIGVSTASAKLLDSSGRPVANRLVSFTFDAALVRLSPSSGNVLSDVNGVASVQISPVSLLVSGAGSIRAAALIGNVSFSGGADFQVSATNLALRTLNLGAPTLAAFGNRPVSVQVTANGIPVTNPVQVSFAASCGSIGPTSVNTDSAGTASTSYKADSINCAGTNVSISASLVGASPLSGQIFVLPTVATNVQFVSTAPAIIYLRDSGAATQAVVTFKVVDSFGNPQPNQNLALSLINAGPGVSIDSIGSVAQVTKTSDSSGNVSVAVFSGTVPTPVQVRAALVANNQISTTSGILTVASGRPVQKAASIAAEKFSVEGLNFDGDTSAITLSLADRQGNPVPDGTVINFVSQSGVMIPPVCVVTGGTSQCKSSIRSQGTRPANGRVSVLAYVQGEEDFDDANRNNVYDFGEPFTDLGNAYRSDTNGQPIPSANAVTSTYSFRQGLDFSVPRAGSAICPGGENGVSNTCDGVWGANEVRKQQLIIFASSQATFSTASIFAVTSTTAAASPVGGFSIFVADVNGNSMPTGSTIVATKAAGSSDDCTVKSTFPATIRNTFDPTLVVVSLEKCLSTDTIEVIVTTPLTKTGTLVRVRLN